MDDATPRAQLTSLRPTPSWRGRRRLHFVQDIATPHNNALLRELAAVPNLELRVEYAHREADEYPLAAGLVDEVLPAQIYGSKVPNIGILINALFRPRDRWLLVAWSNPTTRTLIALFWLSRRRFNCWIDVPPETTWRRSLLRRLALSLLRTSRVQMFAVGSVGVKYLEEAGFASKQVHNLPVALTPFLSSEPGVWRKRLEIQREGILLATGSRFTYEKGFDVLIRAVAQLPHNVRARVTTVIVGNGPLEDDLRRLANEEGLSERELHFVGWLPSSDFAALINDSDIVAHPARIDSYGGASLMARALSKPLIASRGAGAAADIVTNGVNGWLYEPEDTDALAGILLQLVEDHTLLSNAATAMRKISHEGSPSVTVNTLLENAW